MKLLNSVNTRLWVLAVWVLLCSILVSACTMELSQPTEIVSPAQTAVPAAGSSPGNSTSQVGSTFPTPAAISTTIPVTWSDLNLTGSLVYLGPPVAGEASFFLTIRKLNLLTGGITPIFTTSGYDWPVDPSVAPAGNQMLITYMLPSKRTTSACCASYR